MRRRRKKTKGPGLKRKEKKRKEKEEEDEEMKNKLRRAKQQLLWESYLKLKMIEDNHNELLKLLKVCQVIEKIKKM